MSGFQRAPVSIAFLLWLSTSGHCQYDPYGGPPYYGEPQPFAPQYNFPGGPQGPPQQPPQQYPFLNSNNPNFNQFLTGNQGQLNQNQQQLLQQLQGSYPNLPSIPFQTLSPTQSPVSGVNRYPFNPNLGSAANNNRNQNQNPFINQQQQTQQQQQQQQQQSFGSTLINQQYPRFPNFPFQTVSPTQSPQIDRIYNPNIYQKPKIPLPRIRVIEFPSSEYFEYGGGKLVQPKRPNSDLYIGGTGGDVPITSRVFIECTGPNQVEWLYNGTMKKKQLSVVTKNIQITIPEDRGPTPGSGEYTYLRLGLEETISEKDAGVYICRDRVLPQNYISIRVLVAKQGKPTYPFDPKDPNTIYYSRNDQSVTLPCKIEDAQATISLHKWEAGKLSCPFTMDGRVVYDRYKGFTMQVRSFPDLEGRYVCVGDFGGELRLMKYKLVANEGFPVRYVDGSQNIILLDGEKKSNDIGTSGSSTSPFLAKVDSFPNSVFSGITMTNLTAAGIIDPRYEFDIETAESGAPIPNAKYKLPSTVGKYSKSSEDKESIK